MDSRRAPTWPIWSGWGAKCSPTLTHKVAQLAEAATADRLPTFEHGAFVMADGWLVLALVTERGGFAFRVPSGGWGWMQRLA
jgi:hypothetical protein